MELDNAVNNLDNVEQIDSELSALASIDADMELEDQLDTELGEMLQVEIKYTGEDTDNIIVNVNNNTRKISATLKQIIYNSVEDFPEVGSDKLLYIDLSKTSVWFFDSTTNTYKEAVNTKGLATEEFVNNLLKDYATNQNIENVKQELQQNINKTNKTIENLGADLQEQIDNTNANFDNYATNSRVSEVESIAKGANQAVSFGNYSTMVTVLNALGNTTYNVGQNIMIVTLEVPDLWISNISSTSVPYDYSNDSDFVNELKASGSVQVGYYILSALETQKVDLTNYVKNTDYATKEKHGVVYAISSYGIAVNSTGLLTIFNALNEDIDKKKSVYRPITPSNLDYAIKTGITTNTVSLTDEEKTNAQTWLGVTKKLEDKVDKEQGKGLSSNDFTAEYISRIEELENSIPTVTRLI